MEPLALPRIIKNKKTKQLAYLAVIIFGLILIGYLIFFNNQFFSENISRFPAGILTFLGVNNDQTEKEAWNDVQIEEKTEKYLEKAEKGDGVTHLARKATQKFLQENLQDFKVTDEHKVYVEDYLAKKTNIQSLELNQEVEFSADLIEEAVNKSSELSQSQLDNLTQYANLVSF